MAESKPNRKKNMTSINEDGVNSWKKSRGSMQIKKGDRGMTRRWGDRVRGGGFGVSKMEKRKSKKEVLTRGEG